MLIEKHYPKLSLDFQTNKRVLDDYAVVATKRLRNKIAGYTTRLMRRIQKGSVRGISFKLQEEERERRDNYVPEKSALDIGDVAVDKDVMDLLRSLQCEKMAGIKLVEYSGSSDKRGHRS